MYAALIKYGLIALAIVAILTGAYAMGDAHGNSVGYKSGWDAQQVTINKMVTDENTQRTEQNAKITTLEQDAAKAAGEIFTAKAQAAVVSQTIVTKYKTQYVAIANSCGWSAPTVDTINSLLNIGNAPTTEVAQ